MMWREGVNPVTDIWQQQCQSQIVAASPDTEACGSWNKLPNTFVSADAATIWARRLSTRKNREANASFEEKKVVNYTQAYEGKSNPPVWNGRRTWLHRLSSLLQASPLHLHKPHPRMKRRLIVCASANSLFLSGKGKTKQSGQIGVCAGCTNQFAVLNSGKKGKKWYDAQTERNDN